MLQRVSLVLPLTICALLLAIIAPKPASVYAQAPPSYFPLATSTPLLITNSTTPTTVVAPWTFESTGSNCTSSNSNLLMLWQNSAAVAASLFCNGSAAFSGSLGANGQTAPTSGFACGNGSVSCSFSSGASRSASAAFTFNDSVCFGSYPIVQFTYAGSALSQINCSTGGFYTGNLNTFIYAGGSPFYPGFIQAWDGNIISTVDGSIPTLMPAGALVSEVSSTTGAMQLGGSMSSCILNYGSSAAGRMTAFCPSNPLAPSSRVTQPPQP